MRNGQADVRALQRVAPFANVHRALEGVYETLALIEAVKCPGYSESVARSTVQDKRTWTDNVTDAAWCQQAIQSTLTPLEQAVITARYHRDPGTLRRYEGKRWSKSQDGDADRKHESAIDALCANYAYLHAKPELLRAVMEREFVFGETYMPSHRQIAQDCGVGKTSVERLAIKVQRVIHADEVRAHKALQHRFAELGFIPG